MMMDGADYVDWSSIQLYQGDEMSWVEMCGFMEIIYTRVE